MKYEKQIIEDYLKDKEDKELIYKGCLAAENGGCMCTGACKEIVGWKDKTKTQWITTSQI